MIEAKIIADSVAFTGKRITTMQLVYPRFIHAEFMTHRLFSRNASSSRAIPVSTVIKNVQLNPAMPIHWGANQPGMQANSEVSNIEGPKALWLEASRQAVSIATIMNDMGVHKQVVNRILEPFQHIHVVVTATEWDNFFMLREHKDAQPEIQALASSMHVAMDMSQPKTLMLGEWHLPYVSEDEILTQKALGTFNNLIKMSAARCARVSYMKHDGNKPSIEDDLELYNMLVTRPYTDKKGHTLGANNPVHASPIEHQATPSDDKHRHFGNFVGWLQYRKIFELEDL
jgi:hypothetical protein